VKQIQKMNYQKITEAYYSKWIGMNKSILNFEGAHFIYSPERNVAQYGYLQPMDLYCFHQSGRIIISYGDRAVEKAGALKREINAFISVDELKSALLDTYGVIPKHNIKFAFEDLPMQDGNARTLTSDDYSTYLAFLKKNNPGCENTDWVREYFDEMVINKTCVGVFENNILASCTDAPGMPYMQDKVQEIGINTSLEYRGKGYAAAACILCAKNIIISGKCPQWSTDINNIASEKLAYKTGFARFADVLNITL